MHVNVYVYMHTEFTCVCICVHIFTLSLYVCVYMFTCLYRKFTFVCACPKTPRRPLSSSEGEESRSCQHWMVTESWLGLLMGSDGSSTLWEVAWVWLEISHVGALIYTYAHGVCMCVCIRLHIWTGGFHVCECVFTYVYVHR